MVPEIPHGSIVVSRCTKKNMYGHREIQEGDLAGVIFRGDIQG